VADDDGMSFRTAIAACARIERTTARFPAGEEVVSDDNLIGRCSFSSLVV
jgi:hypothetical protein